MKRINLGERNKTLKLSLHESGNYFSRKIKENYF